MQLWRCFFSCWITYVLAYLCRVNMSTAVAKLQIAFQAEATLLGLAGSVFFIIYAIGQLINGHLGDRISPPVALTIAALGTGLCNLMIALSHSMVLVMVFWGLNGYFQSMFWGPLMRMLSECMPKERYAQASTGMSTSMVVGFICVWVFLGYALYDAPWQINFLLPSALSMGMGLLWGAKLKRNVSLGARLATAQRAQWRPIGALREHKLGIYCLACVCLGLIKESLAFWAPLLLSEALGIDMQTSFVYILLIPLFNLGGIFMSRWISSLVRDNRKTLMLLFGTIVLVSAALLPLSSWNSATMLLSVSAISAMAYGLNNILLSAIPILYGEHNLASTVVGIFDFCSYCGAAVSVFVLGIILVSSQWQVIPMIWLAASLIGCISILASTKRVKLSYNKTVRSMH